MSIERVREIATYIGETDLICTKCGSVEHIDSVQIESILTKKEKLRYKAVCSCGAFIKWMAHKKIDRVFWKGNMEEIASFETDLLMWMIRKNVYGPTTLKYIQLELVTRVDAHEIPDIIQSKSEDLALKKVRDMKAEILDKSNLIAKTQEDIIANWNVWDATEMAHQEANVKKWRKRVEFLKKKL